MKRQTLVAVMAILETDPSVTDEQSDLVTDVLAGRLKKSNLHSPSPHFPIYARPEPEPKQEPKTYMNMKEAAGYISMSIRSIEKFRAEGELPYHKVGGKVILKKSDLDAFMARHRVDARG